MVVHLTRGTAELDTQERSKTQEAGGGSKKNALQAELLRKEEEERDRKRLAKILEFQKMKVSANVLIAVRRSGLEEHFTCTKQRLWGLSANVIGNNPPHFRGVVHFTRKLKLSHGKQDPKFDISRKCTTGDLSSTLHAGHGTA